MQVWNPHQPFPKPGYLDQRPNPPRSWQRCGSPSRDKWAMHCGALVAQQQGQINPLLQNQCSDGSWQVAESPLFLGGGSLKVGTWLRELQTPTLRQKSFNVSAKPSLFSFSPLISLHLSQDCLFHREMHFLCPVCDACDIFSEINISPAAFSGFWVLRGDNEWGFQPTAPGSLTREFREHLQKCTSVS